MLKLKAKNKIQKNLFILISKSIYSTNFSWIINIAFEIAKRLHVNSDINMGWNMWEKSFSTLEIGNIERLFIFPNNFFQLNLLNCFIAAWTSMNSANKIFNSFDCFSFVLAFLLIKCKMYWISSVVEAANQYAPFTRPKVHALMKKK